MKNSPQENNPFDQGIVVDSGTWGEATTWELVLSDQEPDPALCTTVACVAIGNLAASEITLTLNQSKNPVRRHTWEILGGHIDPLDEKNPDGPRETPYEALVREAREEAGFVVAKAVQFGYRRVHNAQPSTYPEWAYAPFYWATTESGLLTPEDEGQPDERTFPIEAIRQFPSQGKMQISELKIVEYGLSAALRYAQEAGTREG